MVNFPLGSVNYVCGIYFPSIKAKNNHSKLHSAQRGSNADAQKKKSVVILRRHHGEVLVKVGGNLEWIDEEDVDTTSIVENLPREQSTSLPIISSVQEWVQSPWSLQQ